MLNFTLCGCSSVTEHLPELAVVLSLIAGSYNSNTVTTKPLIPVAQQIILYILWSANLGDWRGCWPSGECLEINLGCSVTYRNHFSRLEDSSETKFIHACILLKDLNEMK